jgi:hypothetical protein
LRVRHRRLFAGDQLRWSVRTDIEIRDKLATAAPIGIACVSP